MSDDSAKRARVAYEAFRGGLISGLDPDVPRWEDAPSWIRDVAVVAYLQGKLDNPTRPSEADKEYDTMLATGVIPNALKHRFR